MEPLISNQNPKFIWPEETEFTEPTSPTTDETTTLQETVTNIFSNMKKSAIDFDFGITSRHNKDVPQEEVTAARASLHDLSRDVITTVKNTISHPTLNSSAVTTQSRTGIHSVTEKAQEKVTKFIETATEKFVTTTFANNINQDISESGEETFAHQSVTELATEAATDIINSTTTETLTSAKSIVADNTLITVYIITAGVLIVVIIAVLIGIACWKKYKKHSVDLKHEYCVTELKDITLSSGGDGSLNSEKTVKM